MSPGTTIYIIDDDGKSFMEWVMTMKYFHICLIVVTANFGQSLYSYSENHGVVSDITIRLSTAIAQSLTVTVSGGDAKYIITDKYLDTLGPGSQPSTVEISGVNLNQAVTFTAHGAQSQGLPNFTIFNDTVALETMEQYNFSLSNPSIANSVTLGPNTTIQIIDDDGNDYNNTFIYCGVVHMFHIKEY